MDRVALPPPRATALAVNAGRVVLGAGFLGRPELLLRGLGLDTATAARSAWLARTAGIRDAALGAGTVLAVARGRAAAPWVLAGAACDLADAAIMLGAAADRRVSPVRGRLVAAGAVGVAAACGLSAVQLFRRRG